MRGAACRHRQLMAALSRMTDRRVLPSLAASFSREADHGNIRCTVRDRESDDSRFADAQDGERGHERPYLRIDIKMFLSCPTSVVIR